MSQDQNRALIEREWGDKIYRDGFQQKGARVYPETLYRLLDAARAEGAPAAEVLSDKLFTIFQECANGRPINGGDLEVIEDAAIALSPPAAEGKEDTRADELQEVVAALYKAWPDAEDIPSDWPLGIIGCIEQIISERDEALAAWKVCQQSLNEQAEARRDPTMPVLVPEVVDAWASEAEASYAMAETPEERRNAHGLSLLVEWQRRALSHTPEPAAEPVGGNQIGAAEAEVGRYIYHRIEKLMGAKTGTPEATELDFLANITVHVEEYGEEACADHPLGPPQQPVEISREEIIEIITALIVKGRIYRVASVGEKYAINEAAEAILSKLSPLPQQTALVEGQSPELDEINGRLA